MQRTFHTGFSELLLDDGTGEKSDPQVQSLAHGVLALEQLAPEYGSARRRLRVVKVRGSKYRGGFHDFSIATGGVVVKGSFVLM